MTSIKIQDANLRFNSNHSDREGAPKGIVLHHAACDGSVESIHSYHRDVNGWAGIGYHFYVRKDGSVWRGRPERWLGAHTTGFNDRLGICAEGNLEVETMNAAQQKAIVQLIAHLKATYGELEVTRHRDHDATACPGRNYPFEAIKKGVAAGDPSATPQDDATKAPQNDALVLRFQKAAMADGIALPQYGADGIWGAETANAAAVLLQYGDEGARVRLAQELFIKAGYDLGGYGADGIWGDKTEAAVRAFQGKKGLSVDGIIGLQTWKALLEVAA